MRKRYQIRVDAIDADQIQLLNTLFVSELKGMRFCGLDIANAIARLMDDSPEYSANVVEVFRPDFYIMFTKGIRHGETLIGHLDN